MPAVTSIGHCSTSGVITFDQIWHHLYSNFAGGKDLSNDTQIRVAGSSEPEICIEMLRNLRVKLKVKLVVVRISHFDASCFLGNSSTGNKPRR